MHVLKIHLPKNNYFLKKSSGHHKHNPQKVVALHLSVF